MMKQTMIIRERFQQKKGQTKIFILGRTVSVRHPTLLKLKSFLFCIFSVMKTLSVEDDDDEERYTISSDEDDGCC